MKTIVKWAVKKFAKADKIKEAIRAANKKLAEKEAGSRAAEIMGYGNDASEVVAAYLTAYADDGKMDDAERAKCDAKCDEMVDKYLSDAKIDAIVDALFD